MKANGVPREEGGASSEPEDQLATLAPGDVIEIWTEGSFVVQSVFRCHEVVEGRTVQWRWMFLDDGTLVEISPDGHFRYREHRILNQGTVPYEELVAQDGALVRFEEHVREGTSGRRPVHVTLDDKQYRISCTGTVAVDRLGDEPDPISWKSFSSTPEENVYFGMVDVEGEENVVLGLWTAHVCLSFGREFDPSDVTSVYRKGR